MHPTFPLIKRCAIALWLTCNLLGASLSDGGLLYDNGAPSHSNGFEITHWIEVDIFTLTSNSRIESIKFWDFDLPADFVGSIVWQIYSLGSGGSPGTLLLSGTSTGITREATGLIFFGFTEYITTFQINPVVLPAGNYWIGIHNGPLSNYLTQNIFWETTNQVGTSPSRSDLAPFLSLWASNGTPAELAFQINGTPAPLITAFDYSHAPLIKFATEVGQNYRVEYRNSLSGGTWTALPGAENMPGTGSVMEVPDAGLQGGDLNRRYYRVVCL